MPKMSCGRLKGGVKRGREARKMGLTVRSADNEVNLIRVDVV